MSHWLPRRIDRGALPALTRTASRWPCSPAASVLRAPQDRESRPHRALTGLRNPKPLAAADRSLLHVRRVTAPRRSLTIVPAMRIPIPPLQPYRGAARLTRRSLPAHVLPGDHVMNRLRLYLTALLLGASVWLPALPSVADEETGLVTSYPFRDSYSRHY